MRELWRRAIHRVADHLLRDRAVFTRETIVRRGHYIPRGSNGRIVSVCIDGDWLVQFADVPEARLKMRPAEIALAPALRGQRRGLLDSKAS